MPSTLRVVAARISSFAHATEDPEKVARAIRNLFPVGTSLDPAVRRAKGHYNNEILTLSSTIKDSRTIESFLQNVWTRLPSLERYDLSASLGSRVDSSGTFYLRFDKQEAFKGKIRLRDIDSIRVGVSFRSTGSRHIQLVNNVLQKLEGLEPD